VRRLQILGRAQAVGKHLIPYVPWTPTVRSMSIPVPSPSCFLVEWYPPDLTEELLDHTAATLERCAASMSAEGSPVQLLMTLAVPTDEVVFGVFAACSARIVAEACQRAGIPAQRLSVARTARVGCRETPDSAPSLTP